jgi:hypothetical protein
VSPIAVNDSASSAPPTMIVSPTTAALMWWTAFGIGGPSAYVQVAVSNTCTAVVMPPLNPPRM